MHTMELGRPLVKLPIRFDAQALEAEVRALPESAWVPHPTGYVGNEAVRLITPAGEPTDELKGEMGPTQQLLASPYIMEIMASIGSVWGRSRLWDWARAPMCLSMSTAIIIGARTGGSTSRDHRPRGDLQLRGRQRAHEGRRVLGLRLFRVHGVHNGGTAQRIHLVLDTVGGRLRELIEAGERGSAQEGS